MKAYPMDFFIILHEFLKMSVGDFYSCLLTKITYKIVG